MEKTTGMTIQEIKDSFKDIADECDHNIPYYAYGDNEAACRMSALLSEIQDKIMGVISQDWEIKP